MTGRRVLLIVVASVTVWYAVTFVTWATRPLSDTLPLGVDYTLSPPAMVTDTVECNTVLDSSARDGSAPSATFRPQPGDAPELAHQRQPCVAVHRQARALLLANTALLLLVWAGGAVVWTRSRRTRPPAEPVLPSP